MKANEAPENIYINSNIENRTWLIGKGDSSFIKYTRTDAFIEKAKKWFEEQNEWFDPNGVRHCGLEDFEDFKNYIKGE
jgi:hypothetical protein